MSCRRTAAIGTAGPCSRRGRPKACRATTSPNANAGNPNAWTYVAATSRPAYNISTQRGANGRATWQVNPKNKISFYYDHQRSPLDLGLYVQDKWTVNRLTVNGGLRFEWYKTDSPAHHFGPSPVIPDRNFTLPGGDWCNVKDLVPRMGVSTICSATAGRPSRRARTNISRASAATCSSPATRPRCSPTRPRARGTTASPRSVIRAPAISDRTAI